MFVKMSEIMNTKERNQKQNLSERKKCDQEGVNCSEEQEEKEILEIFNKSKNGFEKLKKNLKKNDVK